MKVWDAGAKRMTWEEETDVEYPAVLSLSPRHAPPLSSDTMHWLNVFNKSTPPQIRQLIIDYYFDIQQVDDFL